MYFCFVTDAGDPDANNDDKDKTGLIVGITLGTVALVILAAAIILFLYKYKSKKTSSSRYNRSSVTPTPDPSA